MYYRGKAAMQVTLLLILLLLLATTQGNINCPKPCVPVQECPRLSHLYSNPTPENIKNLMAATCTTQNKALQVCCPQNLLPSNCGQSLTSIRIQVLGSNEFTFGRYPWMAILGYTVPGVSELEFQCAGSVISERYILTAAHCIHPSAIGSRQLKVVRLGEWDLATEVDCVGSSQRQVCAPAVQDYAVESSVVHPHYNTRSLISDDIALIRVSRNIDFSLAKEWIQPVCLPPPNFNNEDISKATQVIVTGWSFSESDPTHRRMIEVSASSLDIHQCNTTYGGKLVKEQLCVSGQDGHNACGVEASSPLVITGPQSYRFIQVGLLSYGPAICDHSRFPEIFTSVSHYRNWIEENMRP
ncbi:hypothetical protein Pcinc_026069 [Petrolisthes cinctipes]|uniref:CLIP domain-containing serine protease n=1 Tax=Petrolisthes cinctipes TaxID=88211 RepID=A0AAE1F816_PETCI|nr:hypothetical protein Pcinc_026069 [Petrolisthes cinctipes]